MIGTKIESGRISDWLLTEDTGIGRYSREIVTVAASQTLKCGSPVAYNEAGTQVVAYDNADPDGETCIGILTEDVTTGAGDTVKAAIVARDALIIPANLVWGDSLGDPAKAAALVDLAAIGIHARTAV